VLEIDNDSHIHAPLSLGDLLALRSRYPESLVYAGGTYLLLNQYDKVLKFPKPVVCTQRIDELKRISRTESYLEIGSAAPLQKILNIGGNVLPRSLYTCLNRIGNPAIRNLGTLGGNICVPDRRMDAAPILYVMEARIELRKIGSNRWIPATLFFGGSSGLDIRPGEVVTRIRIPFRQWNVQVFRKLGRRYATESNNLTFCGLARIHRGLLTDFRFSFGALSPAIIRSREIEALLIGRMLPLAVREIEIAAGLLDDTISSLETRVTDFQQKRAVRLLAWFLALLKDEA